MRFLQVTEKGGSCSGMVQGVQLELLSRSTPLKGPLLQGVSKACHLFIALPMLPISFTFCQNNSAHCWRQYSVSAGKSLIG